MAEALQAALAERGARMRIINMAAGGDIDRQVFETIERCGTFVVFGSARYGEDTGNQACTYYEYKYAFAKAKKIVLIRMIPFGEEHEELQARVIFGANRLELPWMLGEPMPAGLPDKIVEAMGLPAPPAAATVTQGRLGSVPVAAAPQPRSMQPAAPAPAQQDFEPEPEPAAYFEPEPEPDAPPEAQRQEDGQGILRAELQSLSVKDLCVTPHTRASLCLPRALFSIGILVHPRVLTTFAREFAGVHVQRRRAAPRRRLKTRAIPTRQR